MCGLSVQKINEKNGINVNKLQAYIALCSSATEPWTELDIDKCIVVDDMKTDVEGLVDFLDESYKMTRQVMKVPIKHTDGVGIMLPRVSRKNKMIRGPWLKGLMASFDFLRFCRTHDVHPKLTDVWGQEHDLIEEDIEVIFFASQFRWNPCKETYIE